MPQVPNLNDVSVGIKDLLTERDYDKNKAGIVSQVVGVPVNVDYKAGVNCAYETSKGYTVIKASPKAKGIDGNTAINHELAHILFNSFEKKVINTLKSWTDKWFDDDDDDRHSKMVFNTYHEALNIIEDQRIESLWGKLYLGNVKEFIRTRKRLGQDLKEYNHPSNILLAERFFRPDLVTGDYKHVAGMLHDVEGKDLDASLIVLKQIKPYLDEVIQRMLKAMDKRAKLNHDMRNVEPSDPNRSEKISKMVEDKQTTDKIIKENQPVKHDDHRDDEKRADYNIQSDKNDDTIFEDNELTAETLKDSEQRALKRIKEIKDKMSASQIPKGKTYVNYQSLRKTHAPNEINVDDKTVKQIKRILRTFKEKNKDVVSSDGDELDIGEYIDMKANGYGECMVDNVKQHGLSICVSIDASGSMQPHNPIVERIMSTLWKSVEDTKHIDLKCITWHSDTLGNMSVRRYNQNEIGYLSKQVGGYTPTHFGIQIGSEELSKMKGNRKLLIVITDGYPNYYKNRTRVRSDVTGKEAIKAYKIAMKQNSNVLVVGIGGYLNFMKNMFGNNFIACRHMNDVEQFMMKTFRREVIQVMKK